LIFGVLMPLSTIFQLYRGKEKRESEENCAKDIRKRAMENLTSKKSKYFVVT
jgi:hypothetical protein